MSLQASQTVWRYRGPEGLELDADVVAAANNSELLARLLVNRGLTTPEEIREFLDLEAYEPTSGMELPDMEAGLARLNQALDENENILVYGDFDVDGQTGTSILYAALKHLGASVSFYIPDRATEGHGLNTTALCRLVSARQVRLVITTDTGITDFNEVSLLTGLGVDTIVTDHHDLPENLPPSVANINPKCLDDETHPLYHLCGAGVAFKLVEQLLGARGEEPFAESLLDIAAIGTVVDMMPLIRENRWLVWRGCQVLNQRNRLGINALLEQAGTPPESKITSETLGFVIGPRMNALGRLDRADDGVELLTTNDPERARVIAAHLEALNRRRQEMCEETLLEAERHLQSHGGLDGHRAVVLASPTWHPGIIGLVATRLKERYNVPVFMMLMDEEKGEVRCSARSIDGFHLHDQMDKLSDFFLHFGGHAGAGGFALKRERLDAFKTALYKLTDAEITDEQMRPILDVDAKLDWHQLNPGLIDLIDALRPFGQKNPSPLFVTENVAIAGQRALGDSGKHLKLILNQEQTTGKDTYKPIEGIIWNYNQREPMDASGLASFVVAPELNTFRGNTKVQLIIKDYLLSGNAARKSEHRAEAAPVQTQRPETPTASASVNSAGLAGAINWIDHRSRESIDVFVGQLMLPLQDGRSVVLYHEGRSPDIPFLDSSIICTRGSVREAEELIFWDFPPDAVSFKKVLDWVKPKTIHLVGGKFQKVPVFQQGRDFLKVIYQTLRKRDESKDSSKKAGIELDPVTLSWQLSTTPDVILAGLVLLSRMGLVEIALCEPGKGEQLSVQLLAANGQKHDVNDYLEFVIFQEALKKAGVFRDFLLTAPLDTMKASVEAHTVVSAGTPQFAAR